MLETQRLTLRLLSEDDADDLMTVFGDPEVMKFSDDGRPQDIAWVKDWVERMVQDIKNTGHEVFVILEKPNNKLVGYCGLFDLTIDNQSEIEIGYRLAREAWGSGYATESARAVLDHAYNQLHINRVVAMIDPGNTASKRVAEKLGMSPEKEIMMPGYTHPDLLYVSLKH